MTRDGYVGIGLFVFSALYWLKASTIRHTFLDTSIPAAAVPKALAVAMGILSLILIAQSILNKRRALRREQKTSSPETSAEARSGIDWYKHRRAAGMLALGAIYIVLLPHLGYALAVALLLAGVAFYSGNRSPVSLLVFAVVGATFFYVFFNIGLDVPVPEGPLPRL